MFLTTKKEALLPQDFIPNPTIQERISAVTLDPSGEEVTHTVTIALDLTKITRMNNLYVDIHDNSGTIICHTSVLSPSQIQNLKKLLQKKDAKKVTFPLGGKSYIFEKGALSQLLTKLEKEKEMCSGFGFCFSFSLSVGF